MKKVVSFSLWGTDPKYNVGAMENMRLQKEVYPGWVCRFYVDDSIPDNTLLILQDSGAEIVKKNRSRDYEGLFWRFEPAFDPTVERFLVRDCDSRLSVREADAVREWEESGLDFHCMRDHKGHDIQLLGAMWGAKAFFLPDFRDLYYWFLRRVETSPVIKRARFFYTDQIFLNQIIWPKIHDKAMVHDDWKRFTGTEKPFRISLPDGQFVGQQWGEDNKPLVVPV